MCSRLVGTLSVSFRPPSSLYAKEINTPNVLYFRSPPLDEGTHTLTVSIFAFHSTYLLDYILYTPGSVSEAASVGSKRDGALLPSAAQGISPSPRFALGEKLQQYHSETMFTSSMVVACLALVSMFALLLGLRRRARNNDINGMSSLLSS